MSIITLSRIINISYFHYAFNISPYITLILRISRTYNTKYYIHYNIKELSKLTLLIYV